MPPVVDATWLNKHKSDDDIVLLDIRPTDSYLYMRIPNSVNSDYGLWRTARNKTLRYMLPTKEYLEQLLSDAGVKPESHVVIISAGEGPSDSAAASRVYWTLAQINHTKKSILNGGFLSWSRHRFELNQEKSTHTFRSRYKIKSIAPQVQINDVLNMVNANQQLLDTRSIGEFKGVFLGAADERYGTIKNSISIPYDWFSLNLSGYIQSNENSKKLIQSAGLDTDKPILVYCHTGHRAALSWFVLHELLGNKQVQLYDGSTREWSMQTNLPMTQEINIEY